MKYILSIFLCIFFIWGLGNAASKKDIPVLRTEVAETFISQPDHHLPFFNDNQSADYTISDCILSSLSGSRATNAFKNFKIKSNTAERQSNSYQAETSEGINNYFDFNNNFIKYSCGYYVYTLKHILI